MLIAAPDRPLVGRLPDPGRPAGSARRDQRADRTQPEPTCAIRPAPAVDGHRLDPVLRAAALFDVLDLDREALEFDTLSAVRGSVLFKAGDVGDCLYVVLSGRVKLSRHADDGREVVIALLGPSDHFGEVAVLESCPRTATATVVTDAQLARLHKADFDRWLIRSPQASQHLLRVVARQIRVSQAALNELLFVDVSGRVAKQLMQLAGQFGVVEDDGIRVEHDLTQAELARFVGASRESVNRVLGRFASRGWIRLGKTFIVILDRERLARRANPVWGRRDGDGRRPD